ncbi:MAG TPA: secondary thiamine-phosphate synthase enzyme YjbQ [Alphaproteobacteria bacterium]
MRQATTEIEQRTPGRGLHLITDPVRRWAEGQGFATGLLTLFLRHTSASLLIQENADPDVLADLDAFFSRLAPDDRALYRHQEEGPDDMPSHIRTALTQTQLSIPLAEGTLALGTWQGIYLFEHRRTPHRRRIRLHLIGE